MECAPVRRPANPPDPGVAMAEEALCLIHIDSVRSATDSEPPLCRYRHCPQYDGQTNHHGT